MDPDLGQHGLHMKEYHSGGTAVQPGFGYQPRRIQVFIFQPIGLLTKTPVVEDVQPGICVSGFARESHQLFGPGPRNTIGAGVSLYVQQLLVGVQFLSSLRVKKE